MAEHPKAVEFFKGIQDIHKDDRLSEDQKFIKLKSLTELITKELTSEETLHFSTLFARISFIGNKYRLPRKLIWRLHKFRITEQKVRKEHYRPSNEEYLFAIWTIAQTIHLIYEASIPEEIEELKPTSSPYIETAYEVEDRIDYIRMEVIGFDHELKILQCDTDDSLSIEPIKVKYGIPNVNYGYEPSILKLWVGAQLNLIDTYIDHDGFFIPKHFILEPDYLIDVTAVAESRQKTQFLPKLHLLKKFSISSTSAAMHLGNVANFFLDELLQEDVDDPIVFEETLKKTFQNYPLAYTCIDDLQSKDELKKFIEKAKLHFGNIRRVVRQDLKSNNIDSTNCYIEPSFFSEKYGLQGRLDLLHFSEKKDHFDIIELKSGSSPQMGMWGESMWSNHQIQANLYRMMLESAFGVDSQQINPAIFYSSAPESNLRFAAIAQTLEREILNARNMIVHFEFELARATSNLEILKLLNGINNRQLLGLPPFTQQDVQIFEDTIRDLNPTEKAYLLTYTGFIAREHLLAKVGDTEFRQGLASIWLDDFESKAENFSIFFDLEIIENKADAENPFIRFKRTNPLNDFVNFREGDIGILYPKNNDNDTALNNQIFKCTISSITKDEILIRFRYKQRNTAFFTEYTKWAIEHDFMDQGVSSMYKSLFSFLKNTPNSRKQTLLGIAPPVQNPLAEFESDDVLNEEERRILGKALACEDYFLIVGPPGTGKTSRMLKNLTANLHKDPERNILLMAYTNRAVDEICESVDEAISKTVDGKRKFIRISSEFSTSPQWRDSLLDKVASEATTRKELKSKIEPYRIFIGTVASITGKQDIFKLKDFDIALIDEASQILEPQIIGLLPKIKRFVMIGDQKQLPAIVQQESKESATEEKVLHDIGLQNCRNSYFERIFNQCKLNGWDWAFDMLTHQGRMHEYISVFANQSFYDNRLTTVPLPWQSAPFDIKSGGENEFENILASNRLLFIPSGENQDRKSDKVHSEEAKRCVEIVKATEALYKKNNKPFNPAKVIGIITPYRNQIALIRHELEKADIEYVDQITIDTVERYQGSQREVIIMSFCVNTIFQVENLMSLTDDGLVDRKLNVAITRARQQMIFLGNEELLSKEPIFFRLIEWVKSCKGYISSNPVLDTLNAIPDETFENIYRTEVTSVLKNDPRTTNSLILGENNHYLRNIIIEYGITDFSNEFKHSAQSLNTDNTSFSPRDKVLLYASLKMKKRYYASRYVFNSERHIIESFAKTHHNRICFFDFGAGPMTAGLSFFQEFKNLEKNFIANFIGVERAEEMRNLAKVFSSEIISKQSYIQNEALIKDLNWKYLGDCFNQSHLVIFNFSYIFNSLNLSDALRWAERIEQIVKHYHQNEYLLIFQTAATEKHHYNYRFFRDKLKVLTRLHSSGNRIIRSESKLYQDDYDQQEEVYYEVWTQ
ncbi:AAA domain-containing protein [Sediminitomix flava]|uniref:DNA helicase n=1 Tax=Sediminitomix flava TaxID=379075 RepID=A0A315Z791_SEDFL|nr:AAA domain-containing protein [Sediminitomix flava]PWJ40014.1 superfamily I DNA and/or RNA helicase [Sediminitomix flava]